MKKLLTLILVLALALSLLACGGSKQEPATEKKETETTTEEKEKDLSVDESALIKDVKDDIQLTPDYDFVKEYDIQYKKEDKQFIITAVVEDTTEIDSSLDFADTVVRRMVLMANIQNGDIELCSPDDFGNFFDYYDAYIGVAPSSEVSNQDNWHVKYYISTGKQMIKERN